MMQSNRPAWIISSVLLFFVFYAVPVVSFNCATDAHTGGTYYFNPVSSTVLSLIPTLFPEGRTPNPALVDPNVDVVVTFNSVSYMNITYLYEGAGYVNQLGYYLVDPNTQKAVNMTTIFPAIRNISKGGCDTPGDTIKVGPFPAGTVLGFWLKGDGYNNPKGYTYYSYLNSQITNPDGYKHSSWTRINDVVMMGFEDLYGLGDRDYNDAMITWSVDGNWTATIPIYSGGYIQTCESTSILSFVQYSCTQYALLQGLTSLSCQSYVSVPAGWSIAPDNTASRTAVMTYASQLFTNGITCIVFASGNGLDANGNACSTQVQQLNSTCYAVGCTYRLLLVGPAISGCTSTSSTCDPNVSSSVLYQVPTSRGSSDRLYPQQYALYFNPTSASASQSLNFTLTNNNALVDILLLLDLQGMSSTTIDQIKNYAPTFLYQLSGSYSAQVGLATVTTSGSSHTENIYSYLTSSTSTLQSNIRNLPSSSTASGSASLSLQAVAALMQNQNIGWRTGAFSAVLVITSQAYTALDLTSLSINTGVVPLFLVLNANNDRSVFNSFNSLASTLPLSYASFITSPSSWYSSAQTLASSMASSLVAARLSDSYGFLTASVSQTLTSGKSATIYLQASYPSGLLPSSVSWPIRATVRLFGYSTPTFLIQANTPPALNLMPLVYIAQNTNATLTVQATDADGNKLTVSYSSATNGNLYTTSGSAVSFGTSYSSLSSVYVPTINYNGPASVSFGVSDGCATTYGTMNINVTFVNQPPVAQDFTFTITANEANLAKQLIDFSSYVNDIDGPISQLTLKITSLPASLGNLLYTSDGNNWNSVPLLASLPSLGTRFVPTPYQYGVVTFTYVVVDSYGAASNTATVTVKVLFSNTPPSSQNLVVSTKQDTAVAIDKLSYYDPDPGQTITLLFTSLPNGTLTSSSGPVTLSTSLTYVTSASWNLTYTPPAGAYAANTTFTSFNFKVYDGFDYSSVYTVTINVIQVIPPNTPPVAKSFTFTLYEDEADLSKQMISFKPYINDTETPNNLTVTLNTLPDASKGTVFNSDSSALTVGTTAIANAVRFVPALHKYGTTSFVYTVTDPGGLSATATVTVVIIEIFYPPTSQNVTITMDEINQQDISLAAPVQIQGADIDSSSLDLIIVTQPSKGQLINPTNNNFIASVPYTFSGGMSWTVNYLPAQYGYGTPYDTFSFKVFDGTSYSPIYYATINVNFVNQPPVGNNFAGTTKESTPIQVSIQASDPDDAVSTLSVRLLTFSTVNGVFATDSGFTNVLQPSSSGVMVQGLSLYYRPNDGVYSVPDTNPVVTFTYQIVDPHGLSSLSTYTGVIYVTFVDKPPFYEGSLNITVYEESINALQLSAISQDINKNNPVQPTYTIVITQMLSRGYLWECANTASCATSNISITPYKLQNSGLTVFFTSLQLDHGDAPTFYYSSFKFQVYSSATPSLPSAEYTYNIFVLPVWHAPVLVPISFSATPTRTHTDMNTAFVLEWTAYNVDKDFDNSSLASTFVSSSDYKATYFKCIVTADNECQQGDQLTLPATITPYSPALWRVLFVPDHNTYDQRQYATLTFQAQNTITAMSSLAVKAIMVVDPINQAPNITAPDTYTVQIPDNKMIGIASVSVADPDAAQKTIYLEVSVVSDTKTSISLAESRYFTNVTARGGRVMHRAFNRTTRSSTATTDKTICARTLHH